MVTVLFSARDGVWSDYSEPIRSAATKASLQINFADLDTDPNTIDYIVYAPGGLVSDLSPYKNAKAVLSLWAGVEDILANPTLNQPLARMVDPGLADGMAEWVTGHILRHHLSLDEDIRNDQSCWKPRVPPLARDRRVALLGFGQLGKAVARPLNALGFIVSGWARRLKSSSEFEVWNGTDGLNRLLGLADYIVLLLPATPATENLIGPETLSHVKRGAVLLNPGRGTLVDDNALVRALDTGRLAHATLDVFREEPLPNNHPFWSHPKITVTPHIAAATRPNTAAQVIVENIRRGENDEPFLNLVDPVAGY